MTQMRSMKASLFLLALKLCHSASFECASTMPVRIAPIFSVPIWSAFLRRRQQRMQHLDRRLEHFDNSSTPWLARLRPPE